MTAQAPRRVDGGEIAVWGLFVLAVAIPSWVWLAANVASLVTGRGPAGVGIDDAARAVPALATEPGDPAVAFGQRDMAGPVAFWAAAAVILVATTGAGVVAVVRLARRRARPGMAHRRELHPLTPKGVVSRARAVRRDLPSSTPAKELVAAAGVALGRHHPSRTPMWGTGEDSYLVIAPPRRGKTAYVVIPTVVDHDGPVVVTSTRPEALQVTIPARLRRGPVWVFDADMTSKVVLPDGIRQARWSPVAGCEDPQTAMVRARSLARAAGAGIGVTNSDFWATHAQTVLQCYLHAAAIAGRSIGDVRRWVNEPLDLEAVTILRDSPTAPGWAGDLRAKTQLADRQRDGIWGVADQALAALADPRLLERCDPPESEGFDPAELLRSGGTLYLLGRSEVQDTVAPLIAALVEAVVDAARREAAGRPGGRLTPPLLAALDEAAGIAPLPGLPTLVADGGGSGITSMVVLQSRAQARKRWGEDAADAIVAACTHRIIIGGGGELRELEDLARLVGERDEEVRSQTWQPWGAGQGSSTSTALRRVPIITPSDLQAMPLGRAVLCSPGVRPVEITLTPWWLRPDAPVPPAGTAAAPAPAADRTHSPGPRTAAPVDGDEPERNGHAE